MRIVYLGILIFVVHSCNNGKPAVSLPLVQQGLPYYAGPDFTPYWFEQGKTVPDTFHKIESFSFIDQDGKPFSEENLSGKIYVADFFFTSCPGICPRLTSNLKIVQDSFLHDPQVLLVSHSVMPAKDVPALLKKYARQHDVVDGKWFLLTGKKEEIYSLARNSYFADEQLENVSNANDFLHTENMLLVDKKRRIRGIYKGTSPAEMLHIIADIKVLEKETR